MSCTVTETLNGEWELTLVHDIDERGKWTRLSEGCILRAPVPAAMTPSVDLVTQQYQTSTYDVQIYKITTKSGPLHLRSGTGTNYKILGKYKKGREVIVLNKTTSSWYEVTAPDGKRGYMASQYLTFQRTETQVVQTNVGFRNQVIEARQLRDQPFRIYRVVPELDKVTIYARHIFYDLLDNMLKSLKPSPSAVGAYVVQGLSGACLSAHDFSFYSDLTSTAEDVEWENVNPVEAMLGENGLVSKYGAELARDWYDVFLVKRVGNNTDVSIREKKNLTGISYDVDETDVVTRIMPTGEDADGNILYLPELYIDSPNLNAYTHPKWIHLPVSEAREVTDGDEPKSKAQCYAEMRKAAQDEYAKGCDLPTITLKVDFINCSDAEEYKQYAALTDIFLGDSVRVVARRIGVEVSMRMTQYTYDCLTKKYTYAVEWRGFNYGCVRTRVKDRPWTHWYKLPFIDYGTGVIAPSDEQPEEPRPVNTTVVIVSDGGKVNVRTGNGTNFGRIAAVAPGTTYEYVATAANGWNAVVIGSRVGWVSGKSSHRRRSKSCSLATEKHPKQM